MSTTKDWIVKIEKGAYDTTFQKLYASDAEVVAKQRKRYISAIESFAELYGEQGEIHVYSTPGRTEIGGNHTDHNHGIVMAAAVNLDIIAVVEKNEDNLIRVKSQGFETMDKIDLTYLEVQKKEMGHSASLIRGVAAGIQERGGHVNGVNVYTTSDVLRGSGLSSSAAFEVIIGKILSKEFNNDLFTDVEIAQISQYAENVFFGKPSGLMDQTACAVGSAIRIDFAQPEKPIVQEVAFDLERYEYALCITDTKGSHADLTDEYAAIREEMERVAAFFNQKVLRDVKEADLYQNILAVRKFAGDRAVLRAMHFFAECERANALCDAIQENRFADFLRIIVEGGHSSFEYNQNAYSIHKSQEQGVAVGLALSQKFLNGQGAWRLQGGGFAGTIQAFVPKALLPDYTQIMHQVFGKDACYVLNIRNYGAVEVQEVL